MNRLEKLGISFWSKVDKKSDDECWNWMASNMGGYGYINAYYDGHRETKAHRLSWILHFGNIPDGLVVCHRCESPLCVNPNHLFLGTRRDARLNKLGKSSYLVIQNKKQDKTLNELQKMRDDGISLKDISKMTGMYIGQIRLLLNIPIEELERETYQNEY